MKINSIEKLNKNLKELNGLIDEAKELFDQLNKLKVKLDKAETEDDARTWLVVSAQIIEAIKASAYLKRVTPPSQVTINNNTQINVVQIKEETLQKFIDATIDLIPSENRDIWKASLIQAGVDK